MSDYVKINASGRFRLMGNTICNEFNILRLIDSQKRGADPREAKQERGLTELIRQRCPVTSSRAGCPLPSRELLRDLQLSTGGTSGQNLAGAARPATVLEQAGVETLTINDGQEGLIPRWRGNGGGWVIEGDTLQDANLILSSVSIAARHCGAQINFSRRLRLGTDGDVQEMITAEMRRVVAQTLEDGLINGDGTGGQPIGLLQQGTETVSFVGSTPTYIEMSTLLEALGYADGDLGTAVWLMHPSTATALFRTEKGTSTGQFVLEAPALRRWSCLGLPVITSTVIPESKVILLDPRAAQICFFGPPMLLADPFSGSNSINGATSVIVSNYVDIAVPEPALVVIGSA